MCLSQLGRDWRCKLLAIVQLHSLPEVLGYVTLYIYYVTFNGASEGRHDHTGLRAANSSGKYLVFRILGPQTKEK